MATLPPDPTQAIVDRSSVTPIRLVVALAGLCLLVAAAVLWAFFGRAPETVKGDGIVVPGGGYTEVGTEIKGVVQKVLVSPGDAVIHEDPVATVSSPEHPLRVVKAPTSGIVVDVAARPGRPTGVGQPLAIIDPDNATLITAAFLPAASAELISPGMRALVSPAEAPKSQYGFIEGTVMSVAPAPVSRARIMTLLGDNQELADYFLADGPVGEVSIKLHTAETTSGYAWTIGVGPQSLIDAGTLAEVQVVLNDASVVDRIVP